MNNKYLKFIIGYLKSMRPYTFFVTGTAGILGLLLADKEIGILKQLLILLFLFSSYGLNQVVNDLLGSKEDKFNAPQRPLISGELNKKLTIYSTLFVFFIGIIGIYFLNPRTLLIYFAAYLMNIIYEYFKGIPFLGNLWFGFMLALAPCFGFMAVSNEISFSDLFSNYNLLSFSFLVAMSSSSLCYYTYFKDYLGDKKANKRTAIVLLGPRRACYLNFPLGILPFFLTGIFLYFDFINIETNYIFKILIILSFAFCQYTAIFCLKNPTKDKEALELGFECTPLFFSSLIALINPLIGLILFIFSFISIKFFYWLMYKKSFY